MNKRCVLALPLLLAGCGNELTRHQSHIVFNLQYLAPMQQEQEQTLAHAGEMNVAQALARLDASARNTAPLYITANTSAHAEQNHQSITTAHNRHIRTQLAQAENQRQLCERQLKRLNDVARSGRVSLNEINQKEAMIKKETARVEELRDALKSARLGAHKPKHAAPAQTASTLTVPTEYSMSERS